MRISTTQLYTEATRSMLEGQSTLVEIQNKIASGKNFTSLAEDPVGASRVVSLKRELSQLEMFDGNINATRRRLALEESAIGSINEGLFRAQELLIQAGNGAFGEENRLQISYEVEELVGYLANLFNTRDVKGEYIFAGSKGLTEPFQLQSDGTYSYAGDSTNREIQVSSSQYVDSSDNGQFLFQSVEEAIGIEVLGAPSDLKDGVVPMTGLTITDPKLFSASFASTGDLTLSVESDGDGTGRYTVTDSGGNAVTSPSSVEFTQDPFDLPLPGATLTIDPHDSVGTQTVTLRFSKQEGNILNTLVASIAALRGTSTGSYSDEIANALNDLDQVQSRLSEAVTTIGARLNILDSAQMSNEDFKLLTQQTLSSIEDLDYASASTELAKKQLALEASYASFAKIQNLSLFNYIG